MGRMVVLAAWAFVPWLAAGEAPADLSAELAELKKQVADLARRPAPLKVGVVDLLRIFDELDERVDMNADLRQLNEKRETRLRDLAKRAKEIEDKAKLLRPDSDEARKALDQLEETKREFRTYRDASEDQVYEKLFGFTRGLDGKIRTEIRAYAIEGAFDLVLRAREPDLGGFDEGLLPRERYLELNRRIEARYVLFAQPAFDFTDAIIKRLNEKYTREKAEKLRLQPSSTPPEPKAEMKAEPATEPKAEPKAGPKPEPKKDK